MKNDDLASSKIDHEITNEVHHVSLFMVGIRKKNFSSHEVLNYLPIKEIELKDAEGLAIGYRSYDTKNLKYL